MKSLLIATIFMLFAFSTMATETTFDKADELTQNQVRVYLEANGYVERNGDPVEALDDDTVWKKDFTHNGLTYDYIQVSSGDTYHGGLFVKGSTELVGGNSDGSFFMNTKEWLD